MKINIWIFLISILSSCTSYNKHEDFIDRKDASKVVFQNNMQECEKLCHLQASRSEGSKRAGEILIDKKRYFISCMNRKGWFQKASRQFVKF